MIQVWITCLALLIHAGCTGTLIHAGCTGTPLFCFCGMALKRLECNQLSAKFSSHAPLLYVMRYPHINTVLPLYTSPSLPLDPFTGRSISSFLLPVFALYPATPTHSTSSLPQSQSDSSKHCPFLPRPRPQNILSITPSNPLSPLTGDSTLEVLESLFQARICIRSCCCCLRFCPWCRHHLIPQVDAYLR